MSQRFIATLLSFAIFSVCSATVPDGQKITVDVYFESLCPDSKYFITKQLAPAYENIKDHVNINFVPFGKSSWVYNGDQPEFDCQHGPNECIGNKAMACALDAIEKTVRPEDRQQKSVDVINCAMDKAHPFASFECSRTADLDSKAIEYCTKSNVGSDLILKHGRKTNDFQKPLTFVPSIVINGEKNSNAFKNFSNEICKLIPDNEQHTVCRHR